MSIKSAMEDFFASIGVGAFYKCQEEFRLITLLRGAGKIERLAGPFNSRAAAAKDKSHYGERGSSIDFNQWSDPVTQYHLLSPKDKDTNSGGFHIVQRVIKPLQPNS